MKTVLDLMEVYGGQIIPFVFIGYLLNYYIKNRPFFEKFFKINYNEKIASLHHDLQNLKRARQIRKLEWP